MKYLIVNADDYGRSTGVARGIREAHRHGIVTSTTALLNRPTVEEDLRLARQTCPNLGLGVHLNLTSGEPILPASQVSSLVEGDGQFPTPERFPARLAHINLDELQAEWRAQIARFCRAVGRTPDHLDSHHHTSYTTPQIFSLMLDFATELRCAIRCIAPIELDRASLSPVERETLAINEQLLAARGVPHTDFFAFSFYDQTTTRATLLGIVRTLRDGVTELMCHPGYADDLDSPYGQQRQRELSILVDPTVKALITELGITLVNFGTVNTPPQGSLP